MALLFQMSRHGDHKGATDLLTGVTADLGKARAFTTSRGHRTKGFITNVPIWGNFLSFDPTSKTLFQERSLIDQKSCSGYLQGSIGPSRVVSGIERRTLFLSNSETS